MCCYPEDIVELEDVEMIESSADLGTESASTALPANVSYSVTSKIRTLSLINFLRLAMTKLTNASNFSTVLPMPIQWNLYYWILKRGSAPKNRKFVAERKTTL